MQPRTLLALTLAVLVLGAFIFFYEKDLPSTDERVELAKKVLRLEEDSIEELLIEWDDQTVRIERQRPAADAEGDVSPTSASDGWRLVAPLDARADRSAVDGLVSSLIGLESSRAFEDFDREELGLDAPRARVTLVAGEEQSVLEIGAEVPASSDMVVGVAGDAKAYRVASTVFDDLTREPGEWRDKKLFTGSRGDVERVSLWGADQQMILLAKRGDDFWIESPLTDRADEELVNTLFSELTGLEAETFLDEPLLTAEGMGLEPPHGVLEVELAGLEQAFRLELGAAGDGEESRYGRSGTQLFEVKTKLLESLATGAVDWRSKSWTALQVFKVEGASFEDADGTLEILRDGADWKRGEERVGYTVVSDLLYPMTDAKAQQVLEREAAIAEGHDLAQPSLTITLSTKDGDEQAAEELALFAAHNGLVAATSSDREAVLLLSEADVDEIMEKLSALRAAEPLPDEVDKDAEEPAE